MTLESYQPGSYTQALYTGDFPTIANEDELDRMVELYRRDAGSRLPPGEPPPPAALSPTPSTPPPVAEPAASEPAPVLDEAGGDYGGGGDINFGGRGPRVKPVEPPPEYPEGDWKATAPPAPHGGRWVGERRVSYTPDPVEAEVPSILGEGVRGAQRAGVGMLHGVEGIANTVEQKLADWTGSAWLKATAKGDKEALAKRMAEAEKEYAPTVANVTAAFNDPSSAPRYVVGKLGELIPMLAGYAVGGMPAMVIYGALEGANKAYEESGGDIPAALAGAAVGAASWGAPVPFLKGAAGKSLLNNVTRATVGMPVVSTVSEALKPIPKAVAARDVGAYELPTKAEFLEAGATGLIGGPVIGAHGYVAGSRRAAADKAAADKAAADKAAAGKAAVTGAEQYGPLPEEQGPQLPPRPYPPREPPPEEQGPQLPPRPYQPRDDYGPDLPPRPYPPREPPPDGVVTTEDPAFQGPKGSPETAPPTVSGDPAAVAAIDAAVNPPGVVYPPPRTPRPPAPVEEAPPVAPPAAEAPPVREAARPETTTDVTQPAPTDALRAAEAAGYKLEPDHLDPNRQVAKNPAGEVIGKGGTPEETIADAVQRKGAPYVDEAPPAQSPVAAPVVAPVEPVPVVAAPAPGLRRKPQPAATEEAITKSKAQAEVPVTEEPAAEQPTTVVRRPTKRVEVTVGKRGEAAVAEDTPAQTATAEEVQQRRLAEQRRMAEPTAEGKPKRVSLMADEAAADIKDAQEKPATSKVTRGTPIDEVGEGMQIEHTGESIAETRSKTTTDKNLHYNDLLHDVLQGNKTLDEASEAAGSKEAGTRGRPRRNKDFADYLDNEVIPRAEKHEAGDRALVDQARRVLENKKTSQAKKDEQLKKLNDQLDARVKARGRQEDERANLADIKKHRDQLRGVEDKGVDAPLYRDPDVEHGIKAATRLLNLSVNRKLQDRIERSEKTGTMDSVHDYLNEIINNHGAKIAAPDMVEYARHLLRLIPDHVQIGSYKALFERHGMSPEEATRAAAEKQQSAAGTYYPDASGIGLHPGAKGHLENTLHEITHGVTYDYLDYLFRKQQRGESLTPREQKHVDALDAILKETTRLRDEAAISDREYNELDYAVRAAIEGQPAGSDRVIGGRHELVSQIMSNPYVREVLGRTETSPEFKASMKKLGYGEPANLWQAFKAFVKDIVGFKKGSVLDKVLDPLTDILETSSAHRNALDMGMELNSPLRGSGESSGRRWKPGDVPTDGLPSQWARDKMRPFGKEAMELNASIFSSEGVRDRVEGAKAWAARRGTQGANLIQPTHKFTESNQDVLPAGRQVMDARARVDRVAGAYGKRWGDSVQNWVRELRAGPEVGKLMNDATLAKAYLTDQPGLFAQRNAHLNADEIKVAEDLRDRFNNLTPQKQKLYSDVRDYYRQTHYDQRKLEYENVVNHFLPEATPDQRTALADKLSTKQGIKEVLADPDVMSQAFGERWENSRALVKEIAKLQDTGWREGDYFPLRRYGDWVLRYGEQGTKDYGVEFFERSSEAKARRTELQKELPAGTHITDVMSKRADFSRREFMPESALADMERAMTKRGATEPEIERAKDAYAWAMMRRQVSSAQAQSRMYRSGVKGASSDAAQNLVNHFISTGPLFGRLTHGAAETEGMRLARQQTKAIENASGTPGTAADITRSKSQLDALETRFANKDPAVSQEDIDHARQQHSWLVKPPSSQQAIRARETLNELEKRGAPVDGDDAMNGLGKASGKFNAMSWLYQLVRPMHLALNVADAHGKAQSLLGADYGQARAAAAIVKAMKDLGPTGLNKGFKNAIKAVSGEMQHSDWLTTDHLFKKLRDLKPGDAAWAAEMDGLKEMTLDYNLVDQTRSREVQRLSRPGGFDFGDPTNGKYPWSNVPSNMLNLFSAGEHSVDSTMRMVVVKAAYDLARARGDSPEAATEAARRHAMDAIPVYGGWNNPRLATPRTPYLKDLAPAMMQYKLYGFQMMAVQGGLVRKALFRPEERAEAIKALAGLTITASIYGGLTANLFSLPVTALLGAWDLFSGGEKPHNYETDAKRWIADVTGSETASKFASGGLFGLAGAEQSRSLKMTNLPGLPELREYTKVGGLEWLVHAMTGASGELGGQLFEAVHDLATGNYKRAAQNALPRAISDPWKAVDLGNEGVVDKRGRTISPASQVTLGQQIIKGLGGNPYEPSLARERRHAEESLKDETGYRRRKAIDRYVLSGGRDMSGVRRYMSNDADRQMSPIKFQQLREALKEEQKRERRPEFYGAIPTKKQERPFREATRFY